MSARKIQGGKFVMSLNTVNLHGRLTADPEFRQTTSGVACCRFTVAVDRPYQKDKEKQTDFISCTAWRNAAEFISRYFSKGSAIIVEGSLRNNNFTDNNGVKQYRTEVLVNNVHFAERKNASGNQQQNTYQQPQTQQPSIASADLGEFEEILSDGEVPF
jgi:single-strand DNA-binding protein